MKIVNEHKTIDKIIQGRYSIARFGDGELKLIKGQQQMYQTPTFASARTLSEVMCSEVPNLLIGIPRLENVKGKFWQRYKTNTYTNLYDPNKKYYSAFITRPDLIPEIDSNFYWCHMKTIWHRRLVVLLQGSERDFQYGADLLSNAAEVKTEYGPRKDAFDWRYTLLKQLLVYPDDAIYILSLGPTATVLAYDLAREGRQALDLGHAGAFYSGQHPKSSNYDGNDYDNDKGGLSKFSCQK